MSSAAPVVISGIDAMRGVGAQRAKGFWADAWDRVLRRRTAVLALTWISIVGFFAVFAPLIANGHPLVMRELGPDGAVVRTTSPLVENLSAVDALLLAGALAGLPFMLLPFGLPRGERLAIMFVVALQAGATAVVATAVSSSLALSRLVGQTPDRFGIGGWAIVAAVVASPFLVLNPIERRAPRAALVVVIALVAFAALWWGGASRLVNYESYSQREAAGRAGQARQIMATYTLVPWSPNQSRTDLYTVPPMTRVGQHVPAERDTPFGQRLFVLGTDGVGRDVLSQLLHACRLSISIGLVSTGIAVLIGVTLGALMGYFGGWIDLFLYRVVEVFMAIPVLFLLIVAAAVLPRNTYVMMAIIGCVTWTGAARFTRAEFYKLRSQDFVQGARAMGLPLRSVLFRHMLPNGVTPVLVDASFAVAAAILAEATLSYLGLGPEGQASWGKLLSSATRTEGDFVWWLGIFPGMAIFLTVLAYNLLGEALRDAIDPKLRKAAN